MALGPAQIVIIVAVLVLLFGAGRIAALGRGLGEGIKNFKQGLEDHEPQRLVERSKDSTNGR